MIRKCALLDSLPTRTAFPAFASGLQCAASSVIPRRAICLLGRGKKPFVGSAVENPGFSTITKCATFGSLLRRYSDSSGDRTPRSVLPELRPREAREAAL